MQADDEQLEGGRKREPGGHIASGRWLLGFFVSGLTVFLCVLVRVDENVRTMTTRGLLSLERDLEHDLTPLKALLGIELRRDRAELFSRIELNDTHAVGLLLASGVHPDVADEDGVSAIERAMRKGSLPILQLLLQYGADAQVVFQSGHTPLSYVVERGLNQMLAVLLQAGVDVNRVDADGAPPLFHAIKSENFSVQQLLLRHGANVNAKASDGTRALHLAVSSKNLASIKQLMEYGANTHAADREGKTPIDYARSERLEEVLTVLGAKRVREQNTPASLQEDLEKIEEVPRGEDDVPHDFEERGVDEELVESFDDSEPIRERGVRYTRLRADKPNIVWHKRRTLKLHSVRVRVRNTGPVDAQGIEVKVRAPDGGEVSLKGPSFLAENQRDFYTAAPDLTVLKEGKARVIVTCDNCYR